MKKIKFILFFVLAFFSLFLVFDNSTADQDNVISIIDGASIRTKTVNSSQGLRFTAKIPPELIENEHGFYVAYGKTNVSSLLDALNLDEENPMINGKNVHKVFVPSAKENGEFSVVLTGIPNFGYFDEVSVIPFVVIDEDLKLVDNPVSRSVASVALKMANEGLSIDKITDLSFILNSNKKHIYQYPNGDIVVTSSLIQNDYMKLEDEFVKDWNKKFGTSFENIEQESFTLSATTGLNSLISENDDIKDSNIYKFFNDVKLKPKWNWFLSYLVFNSNTEELENQVNAIRANGTFDDSKLYNSVNLIYSISNFFNKDHYSDDYESIDFTDNDRYSSIRYFNGSVYVDLETTKLYEVGESFVLPSYSDKEGYLFNGYDIDDTLYKPSDSFTVTDENITLNAQFAYYTYTIEFYDKTVVYDDLEIEYTIDSIINLPIPEKAGYEFLGWYEDYNFNSEVTTKINKGTTGAKTFYARWVETTTPVNPNEEFTITYNLNGGAWPIIGSMPGYTNRDVMIKDFLTEFYNFLKPAGVSLNDFLHGTGKTSGYDGLYSDYISDLRELNDKTIKANSTKFVNQLEYNKWVPLIDLMDEYTSLNPAQAGQFWSSNYTAGLRFKPFILKQNPWGASEQAQATELTNKIPNALKNSIPGVQIDVPSKYKFTTENITLPIPIKSSDTFLGWYEEFNFSGDVVNVLTKGSSGNKVYYALWSTTEVPVEPDSISFNDSELEINLNEEITLTPVVTGLTSYQLVYTTSDSSIVSVDNNGKIKGLKVGKAEINVNVKNTIKKACILISVVDPNAEPEIIFDDESIGLLKDSSFTPTYVVINALEYLLIWESANPLVATVDQNGKIIAVNKGETTITATILDTDISASISVIVAEEVSLTISHTVEGCQENTIQLVASIIPLEFDDGVTWNSSNEDIAVVLYDGLVVVKDSGQVTFTATSKFNPLIKQTIVLNFEYSPEGGVLLKEIEIEL